MRPKAGQTSGTMSKTPRAVLAALVCLALTASCDQRRMKQPSMVQHSPAAAAPPKAVNAAQATQDKLALRDADISNAVERQLFLDGTVNSQAVEVSTTQGIVVLTGTVTNILSRERAERLASLVKGVRGVSNRLLVEPAKREDGAIKGDVVKALRSDPAVDRHDISVEVHEQNVTLTGKVRSLTEKELARRAAQAVKGVRGVENQIRVIYEGTRTDAEVAEDVRARLSWDALVDDRLIEVRVKNGVVLLSGSVGSLAEKRRARTNSWVPGIREVDVSALKIDYDLEDAALRESDTVIKSPDAIEDAISRALLVDPRVSAQDIAADAKGAIVTLTGTVDNLRAKHVAGELARNTTGVTGVENEIRVVREKPLSDQALKHRIDAAIQRNPVTERYEIAVDAENGVVTLQGIVDTFAEKAEAEDAAGSVRGAVEVKNRITVRRPTPFTHRPYMDPYHPYVSSWAPYVPTNPLKTDLEIARDIQNQLYWSPFVDREQLQVSVVGGIATLTGTVDSWLEKRSAVESAFEGGAIGVDNNLAVE